MVADPVPDAPCKIVVHAARNAALQAHDEADAVTVTGPSPPSLEKALLEGARVNVQLGVGCVTPSPHAAAASMKKAARKNVFTR